MKRFSKTLNTPVGELILTASRDSVISLLWKKGPAGDTESCPLLKEAEKQLKEYFAGKRQSFDLPLHPSGTPFQERVWRELRNIPYGKTLSYVELAVRVGSPGASRAVGSANGKNPICIFIPCHRVVRRSGELGGFGGGVENKALLLDLEKGGR